MKRKITVLLLIVVFYLLQSTVFPAFSFADIVPNLMIILVSSFGFMRGRKEGMIIGLISGIILDVFCGFYFGIYALLYMYIGFVNGILHNHFYPDDIKLPLFLIGVSDLSYSFIVYLLMFMLRSRFKFGYYFKSIIMPEFIYTMIVAIVLYFILLKINQHLEAGEKRSGSKFEF